MLSAKIDARAAKRFFRKMLKLPQHSIPRVINVDQNRACPSAVEELKEEGVLSVAAQLRRCKYLNNIVLAQAPGFCSADSCSYQDQPSM